MINLKQEELNQWARKNFPNDYKNPEHANWMILGMAEEVGELAHWRLKSLQGVRGVDFDNCKLEIADAFGDAIIYGMQVLSDLDIDAEEALRTTIEKILKRDWIKHPLNGGEFQSEEKI